MAVSENAADDLMHDRLLTTGEVGEMLGLSSEAVLRRWRAGELPGFRLSSKVLRFRESEVLAWLEARRVGPRLGIVETSRTKKESDDAG
jgi:excisionase family DNA binding protein